jgi:hypothetical protein
VILRIVRYVAADRALAHACIADLNDARYTEADESPEYAAAHERVRVAEDALSPRGYVVAEWITERVSKRLWVRIFDFEDELARREIWRGQS